MSESEVQHIRNSGYEWNLPENPADSLTEFNYFYNNFGSDTFSSLTIDIPNHLLNLNENLSQLTPAKGNELSTPTPESENSILAALSSEEFFQSINSSACDYLDQVPHCPVKNEMATLLNLDHFPEALTKSSDIASATTFADGSANLPEAFDISATKSKQLESVPPVPIDSGNFSLDLGNLASNLNHFPGEWGNAQGDVCNFDAANSHNLRDWNTYADNSNIPSNFTEIVPVQNEKYDLLLSHSGLSGSHTVANDVLEETSDNCELLSEWSDIGGAAVLCRSLPEGSKELLSYVKIPDEAKKRKFLTVREMLSIKKKLTKAQSKLQKETPPFSEDSLDEYSLAPTPSPDIDTVSNPALEGTEEPSPKKLRITRVSKRKKGKKVPSYHELSDEDSTILTPNSVDSHRYTPTPTPNTPILCTPAPPTPAPLLASSNCQIPLSESILTPVNCSITDGVVNNSGWSELLLDVNENPGFSNLGQPSSSNFTNMPLSISPRSREVFNFVHPAPNQIIPVGRNSNPESYSRPRHFEFRLLQIGAYQFVAGNCDPNERLSRLKVIFTTQKLVYEYELPPRIPCTDEGQVLITRMISVEVPFSTVVGLNCTDTVVRLLVDTEPFVFVGYRTHYPDQSRCCVYERMAESDFTNGELATSPLHRLVLIRPEAANKLRYHLSNFNPRFAHLLRSPFPVANHIPHWPLRQQNIFTIPRDEPSPTLTVSEECKNLKKQCSCRVSCRSKRCSCARQGKPCHSDKDCRCSNCDNPLNILYRFGINLLWAKNQQCLMDNIFSVESTALKDRLQRPVMCPSCGISLKLAQILSSNNMNCPSCSLALNYSWCKGVIYSAESNRWQHCKFCYTCLSPSFVHCQRCEMCVEPIQPNNVCPRCKLTIAFDEKISFHSQDDAESSVISAFAQSNSNFDNDVAW